MNGIQDNFFYTVFERFTGKLIKDLVASIYSANYSQYTHS